MMKSAFGFLRWSPDVFWNATMFEYTSAVEGLMLAKGVKRETTMTRAELLDLIAEDERTTKAG